MSDWQSDLDKFLGKQEEKQQVQDLQLKANKALVGPFTKGKVLPAFEEVKAALKRHGRRVEIKKYIMPTSSTVNIVVSNNGNRELHYQIVVEVDTWHDFPVFNASLWTGRGWNKIINCADASKLTQADIRQSVLEAYKQSTV